MRSSSKGAVDGIPPLPARNYDTQDVLPRYVPAPGSYQVPANLRETFLGKKLNNNCEI